MADSLEANFALDSDLEEGSSSTGHGQFTKSSNTIPPAKSGKRLRTEDEDGEGEGEEAEAMKVAAGASSAEKKARRKARTKARKARIALEQSVSSTSSSSHNPALLPGFAQVDYLRKEMRKSKAWKDLSELELGEKGVGEGEILESIDWKGGRELEDISLFIKKFAVLPKLDVGESEGKENQQRMGAPHILVLTNNALRAAHIARELRKLLPERLQVESSFKDGPGKKSKRQKVQAIENPDKEEKDGPPPTSESSTTTRPLQIAKLFSRHFTPAQQISFLATHPVLAGAGTPQRIALLLSRNNADTSSTTEHQNGEGGQSSPLDLTNLTTLVLDAGWKDEKMRSLFDEQGVREAWVEIWEEVRKRRERGEVKVLLF